MIFIDILMDVEVHNKKSEPGPWGPSQCKFNSLKNNRKSLNHESR